jgi:hypothetical protein
MSDTARHMNDERLPSSYEEIRAALKALVGSRVRASVSTDIDEPDVALHSVVECVGILGRPELLGDPERGEEIHFPIHSEHAGSLRIARRAFVEGIVSPGVLGVVFQGLHLRVAKEPLDEH